MVLEFIVTEAGRRKERQTLINNKEALQLLHENCQNGNSNKLFKVYLDKNY